MTEVPLPLWVCNLIMLMCLHGRQLALGRGGFNGRFGVLSDEALQCAV